MANSFFQSNRSSKRNVRFARFLALALGSCVLTELPAQVVVVPNALATDDGNSVNTSPSGPTSVREMQIYDASQFGALSGPSFLTQFAYRPDRIPGPSGPRTVSLRIFASTSSRSVAELSTTFSDNVGTNNVLAFEGTLTWHTANMPGPGNTRQFDVVFPLTTPFLYDPAVGNLLLSIQFTASGSSIGFDSVTGDPTLGEVINISDSNADTGSYLPSLKVTQFTFEPPPVVTIRASEVEVCWNSISNATYQVQYRSDLTANVWTPLVDCVRSTGPRTCIVDPVAIAQPRRFYRALVTNCISQ